MTNGIDAKEWIRLTIGDRSSLLQLGTICSSMSTDFNFMRVSHHALIVRTWSISQHLRLSWMQQMLMRPIYGFVSKFLLSIAREDEVSSLKLVNSYLFPFTVSSVINPQSAWLNAFFQNPRLENQISCLYQWIPWQGNKRIKAPWEHEYNYNQLKNYSARVTTNIMV